MAALSVQRVSVLVVECPGWGRTRCAVEAELRRRGWRLAVSPADADALLVCGEPGDALRSVVDAVWEQLPGPRARSHVDEAAQVGAVVDELRRLLLDDGAQRRAASHRPVEVGLGASPPALESDDRDVDPGDDMDPMDMEDMDMDMPMPGGVPLASGESDRDGLEMDVLHVPLGPVLPDWPAGLVLRCTLAGDVVTAADAVLLGSAAPAPQSERILPGSVADDLDRVARVLSVVGWRGVAAAATQLRDRVLTDARASQVGDDVRRLSLRVRRSRSLRWSVQRSGSSPDAAALVCALLDAAADALSGGVRPDHPLDAVDVQELARRVVGHSLPAVRLVVATARIHPDPERDLATGEAA